MAKLARKSGVSEKVLSNNITDRNRPLAGNMLKVAQAADVNLYWLLSGHGKPTDPNISFGAFDTNFLEKLIRVVTQLEAVLGHFQGDFAPEVKAQLVALTNLAAEYHHQHGDATFYEREGNMSKAVYFSSQLNDPEKIKLLRDTLIYLERDNGKITSGSPRFVDEICKANMKYYGTELGDKYYNRAGFDLDTYNTFLMGHIRKLVVDHFGDAKSLSVLDAGAGTGRHSLHIHDQWIQVNNLKLIDGCEKAHRMCLSHEQRGHLPPESVHLGDIRQLPFENNSFDFVMCAKVMQNLPYFPGSDLGAEEALAEMKRVTKSGGLIYLNSLYGEHRRYVQFEERYTEADFENLAKQIGLRVKHIKRRDISEYQENRPGRDPDPDYQDTLEAVYIKR